MLEIGESSHSGTCTPAVLRCAITQAETPSMHWVLPDTEPYFQAGQMPRPPANV